MFVAYFIVTIAYMHKCIKSVALWRWLQLGKLARGGFRYSAKDIYLSALPRRSHSRSYGPFRFFTQRYNHLCLLLHLPVLTVDYANSKCEFLVFSMFFSSANYSMQLSVMQPICILQLLDGPVHYNKLFAMES